MPTIHSLHLTEKTMKHMPKNTPAHAFGFSIIELMVALAILSILAAFAVPAYQDYRIQIERNEAQAALLRATQWIEQQIALSGTPTQMVDPESNAYLDLNNTTLLDAGFGKVPFEAETESEVHHTLSFSTSPSNTGFVLQAVSVDDRDEQCPTLTLDNYGTRGPADTQEECW